MKMHELLATPDRWTQGCCARNEHGQHAPAESPNATCWCLIGATIRCYPLVALDEVYQKLEAGIGHPHIAAWNDGPARTHEEVLALLTDLDL